MGLIVLGGGARVACSADPPSSSGSRSSNARLEARIRRARDGSNSALGDLFEACRRYMLLVANRAVDSDLRPKAGASDLVQETFIEARKAFSRFNGTSEEELFAWLTRILAHQVQKQARTFRTTRKRDINREEALDAGMAALFLSGGDDTPSALVVAREERQRVQAALERLPADQNQVLLLRSWQQLTFKEIGTVMNRSPDAARKLWARAVERLGRELETPP